jgi:hypothetical protein
LLPAREKEQQQKKIRGAKRIPFLLMDKMRRIWDQWQQQADQPSRHRERSNRRRRRRRRRRRTRTRRRRRRRRKRQ